MQRLAACGSLALLGVVAIVFGLHFQHTFSIYEQGRLPDAVAYQAAADRLLVIGQIGVIVAFVAMVLWSATAVLNARRVLRSLRSAWVAVGGWLLVPVAALVAHAWIDRTLQSGMFIAGLTCLMFLYLPHGTVAGASTDLGGSTYLARVWYLLEALAGILLWAALAGVKRGLPATHPQAAMQEKAFLCFVAGVLLLAGASTFFATARRLSGLTHHKWQGASVPPVSFATYSGPIGSVNVVRPAGFAAKPMLPTAGLRIGAWAALTTVNLAAITATFVDRRHAILTEVRYGSGPAHVLLTSSANTLRIIMLAGVAAHVLYVLWALVAAVNARRRTLLAPAAWVIAATFLSGTTLFAFSDRANEAVGVTGVMVAGAATFVGFVIGQLLLGRSVVALGGRGRIFLVWLLFEFGVGACTAYIARLAHDDVKILSVGALLVGCSILSSVCAWIAMTRLDAMCRATSTATTQPHYWLRPRALTSSHS
ncbi:unannotated protein [freshwater metagenome]|uniref:Unannotated protein n=1 Tax=freshwater metagenome TaxID=449393 RepID=A0A6J7D275_9ZZZZ